MPKPHLNDGTLSIAAQRGSAIQPMHAQACYTFAMLQAFDIVQMHERHSGTRLQPVHVYSAHVECVYELEPLMLAARRHSIRHTDLPARARTGTGPAVRHWQKQGV